jgi:Uma2 family endonuclease
MSIAEPAGRTWLAGEFLLTDQREFGPAWRYELVDGRIVGHAAPSPDHAAIAGNLAGLMFNALRGQSGGCRLEVGSGAAPKRQQRNTARIPDVSIRCGEHLRVVFEVISSSELRHWRDRDQKRRDLQDVEGVREIVEVYQAEPAVHVYRRADDGAWTFTSVDGLDAVLGLESVGIELPLAEIYRGLDDLSE